MDRVCTQPGPSRVEAVSEAGRVQAGSRVWGRIRSVTRSRGCPLLEPPRLLGYDLVASALCDRDSKGHFSPFKAGVHKGPKCMLFRTAHKGAHAGMCRQVSEQGCKARGGPQVFTSVESCAWRAVAATGGRDGA
jgi:hypothetical protein